MEDIRRQLDDLARRVRALEDELAIHRLIVRYGLGVDTGDADRGRQGVRDMVRGPRHQAMLPNCAHQIGPAVVELHGDRAVATGYSRVYVRRPAGIEIYRVSFNRWELERRDGEWLVARRTTRLLGHEEAQRVFG
jgi:hypothetical protein